MTWIIWPQEGAADPATVGGKAKALWTLWQHDFPVPPFFCLTTAAYQQWCDSGKPALPSTAVQKALRTALECLTEQGSGTERYAVRSSAIAEDAAEASFAGQFHTCLNVPITQVAEAVAAVWRSAETATAIVYQTHVQRAPGGRRVRTVAARLRPWLDQHRYQDMSQLTLPALFDLFEQAHEISYQLAALHIATTSGASATFETLHRLLQAWCGDTARDLVAHLTAGLREVASASPGRELAALAALVRHDDTLHAALLDADPWRRLHDLQGPAATTLCARLEQFLTVHGHRGVKEFDLAARTWAEDPHSVMVLLRNLLVLPPAKSEQVTPEVQRLTTTRAIAQRLALPQRLVFRIVLRWTQTYIMLREHTKSLWVEVHHLLRRLFRDVGHRLTMQGVLAAPDEVYFLTMTELRPFLMTGATAVDLSAIIRRRRVAFARHQHLQLPETFQGHPQPLPPTPPAATARMLHGIPVCPGIITGPARIIMDPRQEATIFPGEILITPVIDIGWTPLFLVAAELVVDVGGPLSHGAIVAREYGVPTVVNVQGATRVFRTGELLTLNGSTGEVWG